ncbi:MAG TPA: AMP-binding protein, partial [Solirubrobacteraceae bacterium]
MTLSYAHGADDRPLLGETIGENLERTTARVPDSDALVCVHQNVRYTYSELGEAVDRLARGMLAAGLERGDRVGVWSPNRAEWALVQFATAKLGVILVNVNPSYRVNELEYALAHSGCRWLIAAQECRGSDYVAMVDAVRDSLSSLERTIYFGTDEWAQLADGGASEDLLRSRMAELDFDDPIN